MVMACGEIPVREMRMMLRWIGLSKPDKLRNDIFNGKQSKQSLPRIARALHDNA
jgi:hypothetical protein